MSHVYNYSKELVGLTTDPKERAGAIRTRRLTPTVRRREPRIGAAEKEESVIVPLSYLLSSRVRNWLRK